MRAALIIATGMFSTGILAAAPAWAQTAYVSNEKDNSISVIDMLSLKVKDTIKTGKRPRGITLSPDFKRLYVCASDSDTIQVIDLATKKVLHNLPSGEDPEQFALHPDGRRLFVANEDSNVVTIIDTETRSVLGQVDVGVEPEGMAVSPDGRMAVNTSETTNMVHWMDADKRVLVDNTLVGPRPRHAEYDHDGKRLWVTAEVGGTVHVLDTASRQEIKTISFAIPGIAKDKIQPVGLKLTKDGALAFVALGPANHVAVLDARTYAVKGYLLVGRRVWHLAFTPDEKTLLTTNGVSGDVTVVDVASLKPVKSIPVGRYPWGVTVAP